ncbi:MAG: tetratricopeptide repeat protein [Candidatus Contendobacter sp.]|nr:tetratricopeptide repeat protein [Candidatus Contendobacter sp.]MDG4555829.1 tetratricopeptide repeat protein [Candidatus Contendobacter sp.]
MKIQFKPIKPSIGLVALALALTACTTAPYSQQPANRTPSAKAPVVDRSARRPPAYSTRRPAPPADVGQLPEEDPLLPREYASDPYGGSAQSYPVEGSGRRPAYPPSAADDYRQPAYPSTASGDYRQPAYPPGAATPYSSSPQPYPAPANEYGRPGPAYPPADERYSTRPAPGALPEPQPVVPRTPAAAPAPSKPAVALAPLPAVAPKPEPEPEPEPIQPPPRPSPPPAAPPAELPPAEITREGNQAVAALLESADKYVKSKQLDKAGAALERALRIEPRNAGIWHDLAQIRLHQGQYQQAESLASKSNSLASGNRGLQSRNWKVIASARKAAGNAAGAEEAEARATQFGR